MDEGEQVRPAYCHRTIRQAHRYRPAGQRVLTGIALHLAGLLLVLLAVLPAGTALLRLLTGRRPDVADLPVAAAAGLALALACNLLLAQAATFSRFLLLYVPWWLAGWRQLRGLAGPAGALLRRPQAWLLAATLFCFAGLTALPHRFLGGADEGSYTATTATFYARGGLAAPLPLAAELAPAIPAARFAPLSHLPVSGFRLSPLCPAGLPLMAAPLHALTRPLLGAIDALFITTQFCGAWSLLLVFGIARRRGGAPAGFAAVLLLGSTWLQVWLSRAPQAEVPLQTLLLASLAAALTAVERRAPREFAVAGVLAAAAALVKLEGLLILPGLFMLLGLLRLPVGRYCRHALLLLLLISAPLAYTVAIHDAYREHYLPLNLRGLTGDGQ